MRHRLVGYIQYMATQSLLYPHLLLVHHSIVLCAFPFSILLQSRMNRNSILFDWMEEHRGRGRGRGWGWWCCVGSLGSAGAGTNANCRGLFRGTECSGRVGGGVPTEGLQNVKHIVCVGHTDTDRDSPALGWSRGRECGWNACRCSFAHGALLCTYFV